MKAKDIKKGTVINSRYEVLYPIGKGGTSHVYLVADKHIGRTLALKVMDRKAIGTLRFARSEIEALRCVRYPLFPAIHDAFGDESNIYIVSEYVRGTSLRDISFTTDLSRDEALLILQQICMALKYLHDMKRPMLYLDLKPDNIIMDDEGRPHLIDFGIAGWLASRHLPVGTPGYSPPEQYEPDAELDERADVFAMGMTYYSIRCKAPPDPDPAKALSNIRHSRILGSSEKSFLARCCAPERERRYTTPEALKQIRRIRSIPDKLRKRTEIAAIALGLLIFSGYVAAALTGRFRQDRAAAQLVEKAAVCMEDGQYTSEGIGIIKACINSRTLSKECEQEFIFEVAVNSMLFEKDYKTAALYFSKLEPDEYPEAADYLELCKLQTGFDHDPERALEVTGKLFSDIIKRSPSKMKYENLIFIAGCYENYDPDPSEGLRKSISVLRLALDEIGTIEEDDAVERAADLVNTKNRLSELIAVKEKRMRIRQKKEKMIGDSNEIKKEYR
ncbi:MAG: serine/threonine protein kinase [Lachnospiraceae bacterium]|nr:serine/threonine protein kinase [Lachnospiraceae bacterium]